MYPIFEEVPIKIKVEGLGNEFSMFTKDHSLWKIHYCADFSNIGHDGLQCIPIFQVLVPTITLEPSDVVTHHWTILRDTELKFCKIKCQHYHFPTALARQ